MLIYSTYLDHKCVISAYNDEYKLPTGGGGYIVNHIMFCVFLIPFIGETISNHLLL